MNVYIIKSQGEEDWICCDGDILNAIKFYVNESDCLLEDIDDISILPQKKWKTTNIHLEDEEDIISLEEFMKDQNHSEILFSTAY